MTVVAVIGVIAISRGAPLLWDEAVYSLRVRDLVGVGVRGHYWIEVRAPGLPVLLAPIALLPADHDVLLGGDAVVLRTMCLVFAVVAVGLTWLIARSLIGSAGAASAAGLLAIAPGWHKSSWQVMPDIPGAVLTLAATVVILLGARGGRVSWWAMLAAPLAGAATLVRYGAPLLIGPAVVAALLLRWQAVRSSKVRAIGVLAATAAAAGAVWFIPAVTGSSRPPVLIYTDRQVDKAVPVLASAADFAARLLELVGPVFGPAVVVGVVVAVVAAMRRGTRRGPVVACGLVALSVVLLMLYGIAQYHTRYLVPALPFLAILAAVGLTQVADRLPRIAVAGLAAAIGVAGLATAAGTVVNGTNEVRRDFDPVRAAYRDIAATAEGPCVVLDHNPTADWYTNCAAFGPANLPELTARTLPRAGVDADEPLFAVIRSWPNKGNPSRRVRAILEEMAVGTVGTSRAVTILDMGTVGRFTTGLEQQGPAAHPELPDD